ncbi:MAG: hypothetical protein ABI970_06885 [Chloroflexota bacterium]
MGHDYWSYVQLLTQDYQVIAGSQDAQILRWLYPTTIWQSGDVVPDVHRFDVPALSPGAYRLVAGVYATFGNKLSAHNANGEAFNPDIATIGWVKVPQLSQPVPDRNAESVNATLGETFTLESIATNRVDDKQIKLSLYWHSIVDRPPIDATIFIHLLDANGQIVAQCDSRPWDGQYPSFIWDKGERVQTDCLVAVQDTHDLKIQAGMYTFPGPQNLSAVQGEQTISSGILDLGLLNKLLQ